MKSVVLKVFRKNVKFQHLQFHNRWSISFCWWRSCDMMECSRKVAKYDLVVVFACQNCGSLICFMPSNHAALPIHPQMALFATPERWLTPLICAHIKILRFLFRLQTVRYFIPSLCVSVLRYSTLHGCTTQPPRNALATLYHWLYWEHLMAQSWWILWAVDLLITVLG